MLDSFHDIRTWGAFGKASRHTVLDVVRERELPAAGIAFLPNVAFAVYDFWEKIRRWAGRREWGIVRR